MTSFGVIFGTWAHVFGLGEDFVAACCVFMLGVYQLVILSAPNLLNYKVVALQIAIEVKHTPVQGHVLCCFGSDSFQIINELLPL